MTLYHIIKDDPFMSSENNMQIILISGLSGSGKSVALKVLEDCGFYCVDNLPSKLLPEMIHFLKELNYQRAAISIDVRTPQGIEALPQHILSLREQLQIDIKVLFLTAEEKTLIQRFSETRRRHPLSHFQMMQTGAIPPEDFNAYLGDLPNCLRRERELLEPMRIIAYAIDTTTLSAHTLRNWIRSFVKVEQANLTLSFQSFGFKHGIPQDADFIFDVRCLPNPYYDPILRPLTGRDLPVITFFQQQPRVEEMFLDIQKFITKWLPEFIRDQRNYVTIGIGCTGGQHRSVYLVEKLTQHFAKTLEIPVFSRHRTLKETVSLCGPV